MFVFGVENGTWTTEANLADLIPTADGMRMPTPSSPVKISGDHALVGVIDGEGQPAAVRAFRRIDGAWHFVQNLTSNDGDFGLFGESFDLDGDTVVVCNPYLSLTVGEEGSVYCFEWRDSSWKLAARFEGYSPYFRFGNDVDLDGDRFVIGANRHVGIFVNNSCRVSIYKRHQDGLWRAEQAIENPYDHSFFGHHVRMSGAWLATSSKDGIDLYRHDPGGWAYTQTITVGVFDGDRSFEGESSGSFALSDGRVFVEQP